MDFDPPTHAGESEHDREFHAERRDNDLDMSPSPPITPPTLEDDDDEMDRQFVRESSPYSNATAMTSVDSVESVGTFNVVLNETRLIIV